MLHGVEGDLDDEGGLVEPETLERFGLDGRPCSDPGPNAAASPRASADEPRCQGRPCARACGPAAGAGAAAAASSCSAPSRRSVPRPLLERACGDRRGGARGRPASDRLDPVGAVRLWLAGTPSGSPRHCAGAGRGRWCRHRSCSPRGLAVVGTGTGPASGSYRAGPLFVGVAALASTARAAPGWPRPGFLWLAIAEVVTGDELLFGPADGTLARASWEGSALDATSDALAPSCHRRRSRPPSCGWRSPSAAAGRARPLGSGWTSWARACGRRGSWRPRHAWRPACRDDRARQARGAAAGAF